jgi:hypothetical protein
MTVTGVTGWVGTVHLEWTTCIACGIPVAMPREMYEHRKKDGRSFWCPNGDPQHFIVGETEEQKLRRRLSSAEARASSWRDQAEAAERSKRAVRGHLTRIRRRIANGVCPSCNRSFGDVRAHMETQHPDFIDEFKAKEAAAQ